MSFLAQLGSIFSGTNPGVSAPDLKQSNEASAKPIQAPAQSSSVTTDANRANATMLAQAPQASQAQLPEQAVDLVMAQLDQGQAPQTTPAQPTAQAVDKLMAQLDQGQAPQAQSPEAQIKSLFSNLDTAKALNLLMELLTPFMGMLGMGSAPAAEKPAQTSAPQAQDPQMLQAIDQVMAQLGQGQAPADATSNNGLGAMLETILNQNPQNGTSSEPKVSLTSQNENKPAPTQAPTVAA